MALARARVWLAAGALALGGAAGAQVTPVPPPPEQQTADCAAPVFATDQLVCSDPALHALDAELAGLIANAPEPASRWIEQQRQWFLRRSRCAFTEHHSACAVAAYRERLALLRPQGPGAKPLNARCSDPEIGSIAFESDQFILIDRQGRIAGTAASNSSSSNWQPFVTAERRGRRVTMTTADGMSLGCRTTSM